MKIWNWIKNLFRKKKPVEVKKQPPVIIKPEFIKYRINKAGLDIIKHFEGYHSKSYICSGLTRTIGYGTTVYPNGKKVGFFDRCNKAEATEWLLNDISRREDRLNRFLAENNIQLNHNEFSAMISFAYNLGFGPIIKSGSTMNGALLNGDRELIKEAFGVYVKASGMVLDGLIRRRKWEAKLFGGVLCLDGRYRL